VSTHPSSAATATRTITPELLAALAQVEGSGNPLVRTYWRWSWASKPFELYRPASSAVGMYQITDGTFAEARHYCIHGHVLVREGAWNDWRACCFNALYWRVVPSDAVELTSAYLDLKVSAILGRFAITRAPPCSGTSWLRPCICAARVPARRTCARDFASTDTQRCGDQESARVPQASRGHAGGVRAPGRRLLMVAAGPVHMPCESSTSLAARTAATSTWKWRLLPASG